MQRLAMSVTGDGPPVVLLHPVGLDGSFFPGLAERLGTRHRVVALDLAGHGASPDAARPGRMDERVAEVLAVLDGLGEPAALVGVSFGGMIAQNVALACPSAVARLVVAGCPGMIPEEGRATILARGRAAEEGGMQAVLASTLERWFTPAFMADPAVDGVSERLLADDPSNFAAAWEAISEHRALPRLPGLAIPALVIAGEQDAATPLAAKHALHAALRGSRLVVMKGAPHMMQIECADRFADEVAAFLAEWSNR